MLAAGGSCLVQTRGGSVRAGGTTASLGDGQQRTSSCHVLQLWRLRECPWQPHLCKRQSFVARYFQLQPQRAGVRVTSRESETATEVAGAGNTAGNPRGCILPAVPVHDVQLTHRSHISDEEDSRFKCLSRRSAPNVVGLKRSMAFRVGVEQPGPFRSGVHLRLVNVRPTGKWIRTKLWLPSMPGVRTKPHAVRVDGRARNWVRRTTPSGAASLP